MKCFHTLLVDGDTCVVCGYWKAPDKPTMLPEFDSDPPQWLNQSSVETRQTVFQEMMNRGLLGVVKLTSITVRNSKYRQAWREMRYGHQRLGYIKLVTGETVEI